MYEAVTQEYAAVVIEGEAAMKAGKLSFQGRATITETLRRCLGALGEMSLCVRLGHHAEAKAWAEVVRSNAKLASQQIATEVANAGKRPPEFVEKF